MPLTALDELCKAAEERNDDRYAALAELVFGTAAFSDRKNVPGARFVDIRA